MTATHLNFSDMLFRACDSYMDVTTCKTCAPSMFTSTSPFQNEGGGICRMDDSRNDDLMSATTVGDVSTEHDIRNNLSIRSLSTMLLPMLPQAYDDRPERRDETTRRSAEIRQSDIFRYKKPKSEYVEFANLCRCTAWSQDSNNSGMAASPCASTSAEITRVHWDEAVGDSGDFNKYFLASKQAV